MKKSAAMIPMATKKFFLGRFTIFLGRRFDAVPFKNVGNRGAPDGTSQIGQCALNPRVTSTSILDGQPNHTYDVIGLRLDATSNHGGFENPCRTDEKSATSQR